MEVFSTIIGGVLVFVLGQIFIRFIVEPLQEFKKVIGDIAHVLIYYADVYSNPGLSRDDIVQETRQALRDRASSLRSRANVIPFYDFLARQSWVPSREDLKRASGGLVGLSNSLVRGDNPEFNTRRRDTIKSALNLDIDD